MSALGEARTAEEMDLLFDRRRQERGLSMEGLDVAAGLAERHSSKLLMRDKDHKRAGKYAGPKTFARLNAALHVKWVMVDDEEEPAATQDIPPARRTGRTSRPGGRSRAV